MDKCTASEEYNNQKIYALQISRCFLTGITCYPCPSWRTVADEFVVDFLALAVIHAWIRVARSLCYIENHFKKSVEKQKGLTLKVLDITPFWLSKENKND